jgi:hypothetical protein
MKLKSEIEILREVLDA